MIIITLDYSRLTIVSGSYGGSNTNNWLFMMPHDRAQIEENISYKPVATSYTIAIYARGSRG